MDKQMQMDADQLRREWAESPRWAGVTRAYSPEDVVKLRGSVRIDYSLARLGAEKFWRLLQTESVVAGLGAVTGNQAVEEVQAGPQGHLLLGLAGGGRWQQRRGDVPRPEPVSRWTPCRRWWSASTTPCCAPTRSTT